MVYQDHYWLFKNAFENTTKELDTIWIYVVEKANLIENSWL